MITITHNRVEYVSGAGQTIFAYDFSIDDAAELKVYRNESLQTLNSHYSVTGVGSDSGGNVVFSTGLTLNDEILILRQVPYSQNTEFIPHDPFPSLSVEDAFDKLTKLTQQVKEITDRCLQLNVARSFGIGGPLELPHPESISPIDPNNPRIIGWNALQTNLRLFEMAGVADVGLVTDVIPQSTEAGLPASGNPGRVHDVTDVFPGLWLDDGAAWHPQLPVVHVNRMPGADLGEQVINAVASLPFQGGTLFIEPGLYTTETPLTLGAGTKELICLWAYGVSVMTTGAATEAVLIRGGGSGGGRSVYGLVIDHDGNTTANYGFSIEQGANIRLYDTRVFYGAKDGYSAYRVGQSNAADANSGAFWLTFYHVQARMKSGGTPGLNNNGIRFAGSGGNSSTVIGGGFFNATNGILLTHNGVTTTVPSGVVVLGTDFEVNETGVRITWVNGSNLIGHSFIGLRGESMTQFFAFAGTGTATVSAGPLMIGNRGSGTVLDHLLMPGQDILPFDLDHARTPDAGRLQIPRGMLITPFGSGEVPIEIRSPGGGQGVRVLSGPVGSTIAAQLAFTGTGTEGRLSSGAAENLRLSTIQSLSKTTTDARNLADIVTIADAATSGVVTFPIAEPNNSYLVYPVVNAVTGTPNAGSTTVSSVSGKSTAGFTINLVAAPGAGNSVTYAWLLVRV